MTATDADLDELLTATQAALRANRSEDSILRYVRQGRLPCKRDPLNRRVYIRAEDLRRLLAGEPMGAPPAKS